MKIAGREVVISAGAHSPEDGKACVQEWVHVQWMVEHGFTLDEAWAELNDAPACTDPVVYRAAQRINDLLPEDERQQLVPFIPRLARCHSPADPRSARRVRVRVSCWAARQVLHLIDDPARRTVALTAIQTAEAWLRGEATESDCVAAYADVTADAAYASAAAAAAAYAADATYASAADAAAAAAAAAADATADALVSFLDELLDQWNKAVAEEGCALDEGPIPTQVNGS